MRKGIVEYLFPVGVLIVSLLLLTTACQRESICGDIEYGEKRVALRFKAIDAVSSQTVGTKTTFGTPQAGHYPVLWDNTDMAGVTIDYAASSVSVGITPSGDRNNGTFQATLTAPAVGSFAVQAVVPASRIVSFNTATSNITINIPASQTPTATGPDPGAMILVANKEMDAVPEADEDILLPFHHATAYGCLTLTSLPTEAEINSIDLIFSVPVSGKWQYSPEYQSMTEAIPANIITLHTNTAENVFFACAPAALQGETIQVRLNTATGVWEQTVAVTADNGFLGGRLSKFNVDMASSSKKTSIKLLSIGNSFSMDAQQYLWSILNSSGLYDEIILGNLYIGGCSLQTHATNPTYAYQKRIVSNTPTSKGCNLIAGLLDEDWDYITMQQVSQDSGRPSTYYPYLDQVVDIVHNNRPKAKLYWHMTWAYQQNSSHSGFAYYNNDQMTMYNAIVSTVQNDVLATGSVAEVLPSGTGIQNLRTSPLGDTITRDGYHLSYRIGCFAAGLVWCRVLSCVSIEGITYTPESYSYTSDELSYIRDAVEKAYLTPLSVTPYGGTPIPPGPQVPAGPQEMDQNPDFNPPFSPEGDW